MARKTLPQRQDNIVTILQAAKKRSLAGRVIWGATPVVTYSFTALSNKVLSGIATATRPVRNISAVAKLVGRGLKKCRSPAYDTCLAPMRNSMQAFGIQVSCGSAANHGSQAASAHQSGVIAAIAFLHGAALSSSHCSVGITPCLLLYVSFLRHNLQYFVYVRMQTPTNKADRRTVARD